MQAAGGQSRMPAIREARRSRRPERGRGAASAAPAPSQGSLLNAIVLCFIGSSGLCQQPGRVLGMFQSWVTSISTKILSALVPVMLAVTVTLPPDGVPGVKVTLVPNE